MSAIVLLGYELFLTYFLGNRRVDMDFCNEILNDKLKQYPKGVFFTSFKGRLHLIRVSGFFDMLKGWLTVFCMKGELEEAKYWYKSACVSEWPQFHHICYWELIWCHQFGQDWWPAIEYADLLLKESRWSRTFYAYLKAAIMCMVQNELSPEQRKEQIELMTNVPQWKQRIAGKSIPMEKFAIAKAKRFVDQNNQLTLPIMELIYLWNGFKIIGRNYQSVEPFFLLIEKSLQNHKNGGTYF